MIIFDLLFGIIPVLIWIIVLSRIIGAVTKAAKGGAKGSQSAPYQRTDTNFRKSDWDGVKRLQNANTSTQSTRSVQRESYKPKNVAKTEIGGAKKLFSSFGNSGYDVYADDHNHGPAKVTNGYSKKLSSDRVAMKKSAHMQYSHTYDGHEPWDKCMPKEKDPWDKDFYTDN